MENVLLHYAAMLRSPAVKPYQGPIYLLDMVLRLGLTILLAALSYRFFETPFLKMKKRHAVIESEPILVGD
jgi:peptidoglycan/LPS O-acetylase OafA/YrhL